MALLLLLAVVDRFPNRLVDGMLQPGDEDEKMEALEAQTARVLGALLLFFFWVGVALLVMVSLPCFWDWVQGRSADLASLTIGDVQALHLRSQRKGTKPGGRPGV